MYLKIIFSLILSTYFIHLQAQCDDPDPNIWNDTWQSCQLANSPNAQRGEGHWIQYDFGQVYTLSTTYIWNTNATGQSDKGFRSVIVDYSMDGEEWIELGTYEFPQAPETARYAGFQGFDFEGKTARYVLITATDNWGHASCYGLAEVKFNLKTINEIFEPPCDEPPCDGEEECRAPLRASAFVITPDEVLLVWEEIELAESYTVRYRLPEGEWMSAEVDEPELFLEGLTPEQDYEYQIQANCEEGEAPMSEIFFFTTIEEQEECGPPISTNWFSFDEETATLVCNEVPDAEAYRFRYRLADTADPWVEVESNENFIEIEGLAEGTEYEYQISVECPDGWSDYSTTHLFDTRIEQPTSTNNLVADALAFQLFPNPAQSIAYVQLNSPEAKSVILTISNVMGQEVYRRPTQLVSGQQTLTIDLGRMNAGIYFVTLNQRDNGGRITKRLVVVDN